MRNPKIRRHGNSEQQAACPSRHKVVLVQRILTVRVLIVLLAQTEKSAVEKRAEALFNPKNIIIKRSLSVADSPLPKHLQNASVKCRVKCNGKSGYFKENVEIGFCIGG